MELKLFTQLVTELNYLLKFTQSFPEDIYIKSCEKLATSFSIPPIPPLPSPRHVPSLSLQHYDDTPFRIQIFVKSLYKMWEQSLTCSFRTSG